MIYLLLFVCIIIIAGLAGGLIFALDKVKVAKANWEQLQAKYKDVIDLEAFKQNLSLELSLLKQQTADARSLNETLSNEADGIKHQLEIFNGEQTVVDCGLYTPVYDFDISQKYKDALDAVREHQKTSLKSERAATCSQTWTVNGDKRAGLKQTKDYMKLMLRAFNGESDAIISNVRWNNVDRMIERLEGVYQAVNKLGETHTIKIERDYFALKLKELRLTYEYQEKLKAEKDEQRRIQEQIREEERVQKETEKKIRESEEEENRSRIALEQAKRQLEQAHGEEAAKMNTKIEALEKQLAEALANKERAKSWAQMTKAGNVYIVSNIGSFGENRFKIGMTRRLDPQDRIDELGNAAVPFEFDVHAMIRSDNAPQLEGKLHDRFRDKVVNLVNMRKEFFDVSIDEIAKVVKEYNAEIEVIKVPEARDFRQTLALRKQNPKEVLSHIQPQLVTELPRTENAPKPQPTAEQLSQVETPPATQPKEYQVYILNNGTQEGQCSFENINDMLAKGQINSETLLWYDGLPNWVPLSQLQSPASTSS